MKEFIKRLFTPLTTENIRYTSNRGMSQIGYTKYYIFGILVAKIQKTTPWN